MSDNPLLPDDPRLTAYALGELDPTEQAVVERLLADSPAAKAALEEIRGVATLLTNELRQEAAPELTSAQRSAILAGRVTTVAAVAPAIARLSISRRATRWISRFAAMAAMVALVAVAAFLPAPGKRSHDERSSEVFVNNGIVARDGVQFDFATEQLDSTAGLGTEGTSLSSNSGLIASATLDSSGGVAAQKSEREVLQGDGSVRLTNGRKRLKDAQPESRLYDTRTGNMVDDKDSFSGIGNRTASSSTSPKGKENADPKSSLGSQVTERNVSPADEMPAARHPHNYTYPDVNQTNLNDDLAVSSRALSGSGSEPATNHKVKNKQGGKLTPSTPASKPITAPTGFGGPGNGGGGGAGRGGYGIVGGGIPGPAAEARDKNGPRGAVDLLTDGEIANFELAEQNQLNELQKRRAHYYRAEQLGQLRQGLADLGTEAYEPIVENPYLSSYENPLSTFGTDVDTASYANVRRFLTQQQLPPPNAVRIEELINYFSYTYPQPVNDQPFSVNVEAGRCPWNPGNGLVRIGLKGKEIDSNQRPASNLVFLVDVSGSMQPENKLPLVKMGLNLLTRQMTESDRVAIVTYSDTAVQRLESTNGTNKPAIVGVIDSLQAGGSTNGAQGIQLAYRAAVDHFISGGTNRVILCTDGDFNVGVTGDDELVQLIQERARTKVFFSVLGFGMGNLKDGKLEKLADKGNGHYAYIDSQREAKKVFVEDLSGTLVTIAKDVKLQVEFNPNQVGAYRLIGYENRVMAAQDFNNDAKDAGDIGAGHTVTALYETLPAGEAPKPLLGDTLRYRAAVVPQDGGLAQELLTVKLRYKLPESDTSTLVEVPVNVPKAGAPEVGAAGAPAARTGMSADFNWAAAVAAFGMILRDSQFRGQANFDMVLELAQGAKGEDKVGRRQEFIDLVKVAKALHGGAPVTAVAPVEPQAAPLTREQAEAKASVSGKYKNLLRIVEAPADSATYGAFHDYGHWEGTSYLDQNNLPQGYWVYVSPNWYIWGDK